MTTHTQKVSEAALRACRMLLKSEGAMIGTEYGNELLQKAIQQARLAITKAQGTPKCQLRRL